MPIRVLIPLLIVLSAASPSLAALDALMEITGATQGPIQGSSTQTGSEGQIPTFEVHHLIERDAGGTVHQSLIVTIALSDISVPDLLRAIEANETLQVTLNLYEPNQSGQPINVVDIGLANAKIVAVEPLQPNNLIADQVTIPATARIRFDYAQISYTNVVETDSATLNN